jgi:PKD repeat protein
VPSAAATLSVLSPHLQFSFEDNGTTTTDSVSGVSLNLINGGGGAADYHGAAGSGVYGHGKALDFSSAVPNAPGPLAFSTNNSAVNFGTLTNFTLAFWFKPTVPITSSLCRLFLLANSGNTGGGGQDSLELLDYNVVNSFRMNINTSAIYAQPKAEPTNQWLFFAATWDGQTMKVYRGTETGAISLQTSVPAAAGAINVGATFNLLLGNILSQSRPFTGLFDDVRFYTGVADSNFLDSVRQEALIFSAPVNVSLTTCGGASLTWSPVPYATGYIVKRSTSSGAETDFATTATNVFIDTTATVGSTYYYEVVATNSSSVSASSSEVFGTVQNQSLFTFVTQPASQTVCLGDTPTFTVATSGDPEVTYLWQYSVSAGANWIDIPSANSTNYTTPVVTAADDGTLYRAIVISGCASVPSAAAKLSVATSEATVVQQPVDQTVVAGWPARFAVRATGTNLIYQWRKNGTNLVDGNGVSGSFSTVLNLTNLTVADSGSVYDCVIGPPCVAVPSSPALLTVNADASNNLMLKFDFEDAANGTTTTDTIHGVTLNLVDANFAPIDLHGQSGSGVAGLGRSLDLSTGTMGGTGPLAYAASDSTINYGTISSFTLTFWVSPATGISTASRVYPRYFIMGGNTTTDLSTTGSFGALYTSGLKAAVNTNSVSALSPNEPAGEWIFLAVTWDGQTANYYAGSTNGAVTLLNSLDLPTTPVNIGNAVNLLIGNNATTDRSFAGKMDDMRLYLGAAPADTLETIRQAALPPVPVASFTALPVSGVRPLLVTFTNSTVGSPTGLIWNFGDGVTNSSGSNVVTHVYGVEGNYSATLTASESGGSSTATNLIAVTAPMPPKITRVAAGSGNLTIQGTNGPVSATQVYYYKLLTSTNLALPRASWTVLATNSFNADGSFSNNIPVTPADPQRFYLQQMP